MGVSDTSKPKTALLMTLPEAARRYGLSRAVVRQAAADKAFPIYYPGTCWPRCRVDEFAAWVASTRSELPPPSPSSRERARRRVEDRVAARVRREDSLESRASAG